MKDIISGLIQSIITDLSNEQVLPENLSYKINIDATKDKNHGDLASNIALVLSKQAKMPPRKLAELISDKLMQAKHESIKKIEIAGPGFINFFVSSARSFSVINEILDQKAEFGKSSLGAGKHYQVEFVSANPTGPLHVGHGRGAAYGASVADLLEAVGYQVTREYYVNDAGRQMNILAASVWLRYIESYFSDLTFPVNGYKGDYVHDIAATLKTEYGDRFKHSLEAIFTDLPKDENEGGDKEIYIDAVIARAKALLCEDFTIVFNQGLNSIVDDIRDDLKGFGVNYQTWFSEASLSKNIDHALKQLDENGYLYEKEGAIWFRSTHFGDDKDRVVKRENGETTYFASDIAYHLNKFNRGFDKVINIWGADHHGYIPRVNAALEALNLDPKKLDVRLVQFAILYRGKERVQMSTRSGSFVTLRELREDVGNDAARFFYVTRKAEQHMDFDLDLAKSQSKDNPVYYIQYAHARIASMLRKLKEMELEIDTSQGLTALSASENEGEIDLAKRLGNYPEQLSNAATNLEPHTLTHYLRDLASEFHTYYNSNKVLVDDAEIRNTRITLSLAVKQVIKNGLELLGVSAPEEM
ncbi:MAG: arginyl-tRNA synthetase [Oleiphilaceae bacterium]|jgi:arginyl-tRNA synthetase